MKKAFFVFAAAMATVALKADWIMYWDAEYEVEFHAAQLYATFGSTTSASGGTEITSGGSFVSSTGVNSTGTQKADLSSYYDSNGSTSISGFYVGVLTGSGSDEEWVYSAWQAYSDVYSALEYSLDGGKNVQSSSSVATFNVPEPTGGLLSLIGFAILALRRKREIVA